MPLAVLAALLSTVGLGWLPLTLMGPPIRWIVAVAHEVSSLDGAIGKVVSPPFSVLPLIAVGGIFLVLLRRNERLVGLCPLALAFVLWSQVERPPILVSEGGGIVGVMTPEGRDLSKPKGEGFSALSWLENDGDATDQPGAYARAGFNGAKGFLVTELAGLKLVHLSGRGAEDQLPKACAHADLVVLAAWRKQDAPPECVVLDRAALAKLGAVALWPQADGFRIEETKQQGVARLWTR